MEEQTCSNTNNKGNVSPRKPRRSFVRRSRSGQEFSNEFPITIDNDYQMPEMDNEEKAMYIKRLEKEHKDWKNLYHETKFKHHGVTKKVQRPQNFDVLCLPQEETKFLNDTEIYKTLAKHLDELKNTIEINKKLKSVCVINSRVLKKKQLKLEEVNAEFYKYVINTDFVNINLNEYSVEESASDILSNNSNLL